MPTQETGDATRDWMQRHRPQCALEQEGVPEVQRCTIQRRYILLRLKGGECSPAPKGRPYYWNFASGSTQWEPPYGVLVGAPSARPLGDRTGEMSSGSEPDEGQPVSPGLGSESSERPTFRIRFAGAHGMTQVAQAFPIAWEPEPLPQARERDVSYSPGQES